MFIKLASLEPPPHINWLYHLFIPQQKSPMSNKVSPTNQPTNPWLAPWFSVPLRPPEDSKVEDQLYSTALNRHPTTPEAKGSKGYPQAPPGPQCLYSHSPRSENGAFINKAFCWGDDGYRLLRKNPVFFLGLIFRKGWKKFCQQKNTRKFSGVTGFYGMEHQ